MSPRIRRACAASPRSLTTCRPPSAIARSWPCTCPTGRDAYPGRSAPSHPRRHRGSDYLDAARALNALRRGGRLHPARIRHLGRRGGRLRPRLRPGAAHALTSRRFTPSFATPRRCSGPILAELVDLAAASVVMSGAAASLLARAYGVDPRSVEVVPHGVPRLPLTPRPDAKAAAGPGRGPDHPELRPAGTGQGLRGGDPGDARRRRRVPDRCAMSSWARPTPTCCAARARPIAGGWKSWPPELGVAEHVQFVDRYVAKGELGAWLEAADVFVTPYPNLDQIVSGTLSYAMGAGKAIVSTPYAYAAEMLADGRGLLVPPGFFRRARDGLPRAARGRRAADAARLARLPAQPVDALAGGRAALSRDLRQSHRLSRPAIRSGQPGRGAAWLSGRSYQVSPGPPRRDSATASASGSTPSAAGPTGLSAIAPTTSRRALEVDLLHARDSAGLR